MPHQDKEFRVLYEISNAMRMTLELEHILYIILTGVTAHSGLGYNRGILFLYNELRNCLECRMAIGPKSGEHANKIWQHIDEENINLDHLIDEKNLEEIYYGSTLFDEFKTLTFPLTAKDSLLSQAYQRATAWLLTPKEISSFHNDPFLLSFPISEEMIIMPLKAKGRVNGLIIADNIYTKKIISDHDIEFFTLLANQAGLAIENSRLYEMVVHQSQTDALTGLWNHGFFQKTLTQQIEKTKSNNMKLSLLFLDIDNFKQLNDTCGHQHGDTILQETSKILKDSARGNDCICRYGGEEFAIILTNTNRAQSFEIAERIRQKIEQHNFPSPSGMGHLNFTVSIGIAVFPDIADTKEMLIKNADKAMYQAKTSGKNKIC